MNHPLTNGLAESISNHRQAAGMTQYDLAVSIGKSYSSIQKYELGLSVPPLPVLEDIADALKIDVFDLIGWNR